MKKLCYLGYTLGLVLTLQSCSFFGGPITKTVAIESYQTQCTMPSYPFVQTLCMVMIEPDKTIQLITGIADFEYEWGYRYGLIIEERKPDPNIADSPPILRNLNKLISKEKVAAGTAFEMHLETVLPSNNVSEGNNRQVITRESPERFAFFKRYEEYGVGREFTCNAAALCEEFGNLIEQELELTIEFTHPENSDEPLVAQRVVSMKPLPDWY